jgi:hypothetical protein
MRTDTRDRVKQWARVALKCGLLLTDGKLWSTINDELTDRAEDARDVVAKKYRDTADRLHDAGRALQGRSDWVPPLASFLGGVGLGVGLGILFAPASGEEVRDMLRDRAVNVKNKVSGISSSRFRTATGTEGD